MPRTARRIAAATIAFAAATCHAGAPGGAPIWGVKSMAGAGTASSPPANLYVFTAANPGAFIDKGAIKLGGVSIDVDGVAQLASGALVGFELTAGGSRLVSIDSTTAVATALGPVLTGREIRGAVARPDGVLLVVDAIGDSILPVSSTTGMAVGPARTLRTGCTPFDVSSGTDLAIRSDGLLMLVSLNQFVRFLAVDAATGALQLQHTDAVLLPDGFLPFLGGFAFEPGSAVAAAYELSSGDDLLAYDTAAGFARTLLLANIIPSFNAGRGDLACFVNAPPAPLPGAVLADLNGDGMVDGADLGLMLGAWGACAAPPAICCADLNGDGVVDGADLGILLGAWD